jgi:hypothetical protein
MSASVYLRVKDELTGFGKNPVADAGKIMTLVQALGLPEKEVMAAVQYVYINHYQIVNGADANQARQSWVAASGNNFESFMRNFINQSLNGEGILAVKGDRLRTSPKAANIVSFLTLRANRRCTQTTNRGKSVAPLYLPPTPPSARQTISATRAIQLWCRVRTHSASSSNPPTMPSTRSIWMDQGSPDIVAVCLLSVS